MSAKIFSASNMASQDVQAYVGSCRYYTVADTTYTAASIHDGAVVVLDGLDVDTTYESASGDPVHPIYDYNIRKAIAPASNDAADFVMVDLVTVSNGDVLGNNYKIGMKLFDLTAPAGKTVRYRRVQKGDTFWVGGGNFTGTPAVGSYGHTAASATTFAANTTAASAAVKIIAAKPFIAGSTRVGTENLYLVEVL